MSKSGNPSRSRALTHPTVAIVTCQGSEIPLNRPAHPIPRPSCGQSSRVSCQNVVMVGVRAPSYAESAAPTTDTEDQAAYALALQPCPGSGGGALLLRRWRMLPGTR